MANIPEGYIYRAFFADEAARLMPSSTGYYNIGTVVLSAGNNSVMMASSDVRTALIAEGTKNTYFGVGVGQSYTPRSQTTYIGYCAGFNALGDRGTFVGHETGANSSGYGNTFIGWGVGSGFVGDHTTVIGTEYGGKLTLNPTVMSVPVPVQTGSYTVAGLPSPGGYVAGAFSYAQNGRKAGEGVGAGTGCPVYASASGWLCFYNNLAVTA